MMSSSNNSYLNPIGWMNWISSGAVVAANTLGVGGSTSMSRYWLVVGYTFHRHWQYLFFIVDAISRSSKNNPLLLGFRTLDNWNSLAAITPYNNYAKNCSCMLWLTFFISIIDGLWILSRQWQKLLPNRYAHSCSTSLHPFYSNC